MLLLVCLSNNELRVPVLLVTWSVARVLMYCGSVCLRDPDMLEGQVVDIQCIAVAVVVLVVTWGVTGIFLPCHRCLMMLVTWYLAGVCPLSCL